MGDLIQIDVGRTVNGWKVQKKLGEGAFGAVYRVTNLANEEYALKVEGMKEQIQLLKMEVLVLSEILPPNRHFLKLMDKGQFENFNYIVIQLVGKSLADLRMANPQKKLSMGTALSVGIQCLEALEDLHAIGYLHRDVKPGNYTVGRKQNDELRKIYVLDFGMARKFVHSDGTIKKPRTAAGFRGTVKFAPLSCHFLREQCRKDDVETWLYMVIELTKGSLPWRNIPEQNDVGLFKKDCRKDRHLKMLFGGCPREYIDIMRIIDGYKFFDAPDYSKIYGLMRNAMVSCRAEEFPYDWEKEPPPVKKPSAEQVKKLSAEKAAAAAPK